MSNNEITKENQEDINTKSKNDTVFVSIESVKTPDYSYGESSEGLDYNTTLINQPNIRRYMFLNS